MMIKTLQIKTKGMIPLSLYIHFPWCMKKCPYCDFHSIEFNASENHQDQYIQKLIEDFNHDREKFECADRPLSSIFLGGGTPSIFSPEKIECLINAIKQAVLCVDEIEITMEANPGTFNDEKAKSFYQAGINRLSIGIQSFNDKKLQTIQRIHSSKEAHLAIDAALNAGFKNINLDLMFGLPDQSVDEALQDLNTAMQYPIQHLSWYQLTIEPDSYFFNHTPKLPDEETLVLMHQNGKAFLKKQGFDQYEISAYAKKGYECRHNLNYWQFGDYLGIGSGAHGKITRPDFSRIRPLAELALVRKIGGGSERKTGVYTLAHEDLSTEPTNKISTRVEFCKRSITRTEKTHEIKAYFESENFNADEKWLIKKDIILEFMMNALRLTKGFSINLFQERTGLDFSCIESSIHELVSQKFIALKNNNIIPTPLGQQFLNNCLEMFVG